MHIFAENIVRLLNEYEHLLTEWIKHNEMLDTNKF